MRTHVPKMRPHVPKMRPHVPKMRPHVPKIAKKAASTLNEPPQGSSSRILLEEWPTRMHVGMSVCSHELSGLRAEMSMVLTTEVDADKGG